jgi:tetratricopeptide (TPR) repeat protein
MSGAATVPPFFRRFRLEDPEGAAREIDILQELIEESRYQRDKRAELELRLRLGFLLTPLDREAEAIEALTLARALARETNAWMSEMEALLSLATAYQYRGHRERAQEFFREGLARCAAWGTGDFDDTFLHHQGRCFVEQGDLVAARRAFEQALRLREKTGDARRIASTRAALAELDRRKETA